MNRETQETIAEWGDATFDGNFPTCTHAVARLLDELAELLEALGWQVSAECMTHRAKVLRAIPAGTEAVRAAGLGGDFAGEMADIAIVLYQAATVAGVDLAKAVDSKMKINRTRKWSQLPDGSWRHVKESAGPELGDGESPGRGEDYVT